MTELSTIALARVAEAMLRALGGESVSLVFAVSGAGNELGLGAATS